MLLSRIHITCDGKKCSKIIAITPQYKYDNHSDGPGFYDVSELALNKKIIAEDWIVRNGKHFCSVECSDEA